LNRHTQTAILWAAVHLKRYSSGAIDRVRVIAHSTPNLSVADRDEHLVPKQISDQDLGRDQQPLPCRSGGNGEKVVVVARPLDDPLQWTPSAAAQRGTKSERELTVRIGVLEMSPSSGICAATAHSRW